MTRPITFAAALLLLTGALAAVAAQKTAPAAPATRDTRLVLLIAVDQFRYDYLTRFRADYTSGFKKLLTDGAVFTDAHLEHYPTVTAVGHATMLTGATPSVSGIIGNDWFDREAGVNVQSVTDLSEKSVGVEEPGASPRRLLVSTIADEVKKASPLPKGSANGSRAIGISLKDRWAIMTVGRGADGAYWFDSRSGRFVTSTYYMKELPAWVRSFNDKKLPDAAAGKAWTTLLAPSTLLRTLPAEPGRRLYDAVFASPFGSELLLDFAGEVLTNERLGQRGAIDVLSISFSSNDAVGHNAGPDSPEVKDISIRTDRILGQLLARIDATVGLGHTIVALTADHGVAPTPEALHERGLPGGRMATKDLFGPIQQALETRYGQGQWLLGTAGSSPYLNYDLIAKLALDPVEVRQLAARAAMAVPHVARVYTRDQLQRGEAAADPIGRRVLAGFYPQRSGDLEIILEPYWIRQAAGATHGSPYDYDSHIPLILMGSGIKPGQYSRHAALNDLAPTLATLLHVETPSGSSGRVLTEALTPAAATTRPPK